MTVNGFMRSTGAAIRRAEREQQRQAREAAKLFKQQQKLEELTNAAEATRQYDRYVSVLKSIHKDCSAPIDWLHLRDEKAPGEPKPSAQHETAAKLALESYCPGFFARLFGGEKREREKLYRQLQQAIEEDKNENRTLQEQFREDYAEWQTLQSITKGILEKSATAYKQAIELFNPLAEINELGSKLDIQFFSTYVVVDLFVQGSEVIPNFILTQTSTGKLSRKNMPISKFQELYQDYVCSATLRIGREIIAYLPVSFVIINAKADLLNTSTGQIEAQPVLSVAIPPTTLQRLNFDSIDPSDAMKNFVNNMKFSKTAGFSAVEVLNAELINR